MNTLFTIHQMPPWAQNFKRIQNFPPSKAKKKSPNEAVPFAVFRFEDTNQAVNNDRLLHRRRSLRTLQRTKSSMILDLTNTKTHYYF